MIPVKKHLAIAVITAIFLCLTLAPVWANPYSLYRQGNCVYFAYEMIYKFWPVTFDVPRKYDACEWIKLVGQEQKQCGKRYRLCTTDRPIAGDFIVWPAIGENKYGHIAFITEVRYIYRIDLDTWETENYRGYEVLESAMYPDKFFF